MTKTKLTLIAIALLATGGGGAYLLLHEAEAVPAAGANYTVENLNKAADDPAAIQARMRELWDRDDLTDEQRREAMENMRRMMEQRMDAAIDEYMTAPQNQKNAVLDKHIDEWQRHMAEWEKNRAEWEKRGQEWERRRREREKEQAGRDGDGQGKSPDGATADGRGTGEGSGAGEARGAGGRGGWRNMSSADRKARSEERSSDQFARRMAYWGALAKRAGERGIPMPGFGGRGGGRGPGGSGGRSGSGSGSGGNSGTSTGRGN